MNKFIITPENRDVFIAIDKVRLQIGVLEDLLRQQRETERALAGQIYAKYEIPVNAAIGFRNWVVTHVGGKELPDPPNTINDQSQNNDTPLILENGEKVK